MQNRNSTFDMRYVTLTLPGGLQRRLNVKDVAAWNIVVEALRPEIKPGAIIALAGPLGAGKTTLVQMLAADLGVTKQPQSPTFALMRSYALPKPVNGVSRLIHVDAYRIEDEKDLVPLDLDEELADGQSVLLIEWPEKAKTWLSQKNPVFIEISTT